MSKVIAVIFAGGSGVRMGADLPKQFIVVNGKEIIVHTLEIFEKHPRVDEIYIACKKDYIDKLNELITEYGISKVKKVVPGGTTGMDSIYKGLSAAKCNGDDDAIVLIHDGVRPVVSDELLEEVIDKVEEHGAVATCTPMFETPVMSKNGQYVEETPLRADFYTAQAPQAFRLGDVIDAHETIRKTNPDYEGIVDNCTLMTKLGKEVAIVKGPRSNIKVTTTEDLYILKAMLELRDLEQSNG